MGRHTEIQWCDSTVNASTGCDGCELWLRGKGGPCYAGNLHERRLSKALPALYAPSFTDVRTVPGRMAKAAGWPDLTGQPRPAKPWLDGMPRMVFVNDLGDLFSKAVPFGFVADEVMFTATRHKNGHKHIYLLLTKQPKRMYEFSKWYGKRYGDWPPNVWPGVSLTTPRSVRRIDWLRLVPATVRFLSLEPLWEFIDLTDHLRGDIHWVIVGGESSQGGWPLHPFPTWLAYWVVYVSHRAGVPCFIKQVGSDPRVIWPRTVRLWDSAGAIIDHSVKPPRVVLKDSHGGDWNEWPEVFRVREVPRVIHTKDQLFMK